MKTTHTLLTFALCVLCSTPALAQDAAPAPADAPAVDAAPAPEAEAMPTPEATPAPEPAPMPAAAPAPAPAPDKAADEPKDDDEADKCVFGKLCFGPVITGGLFNPIGFGLHLRYGDYLGAGLDYQFLPTVSVGDITAGMSLVSVDLRLYPFGGSFFLGTGFAYQSMSATAKTSGTSLDGSLGIPTILLSFGLMGHDGFVMGIDLALEFPLGGTDVDFSQPKAATGVAAAELDTQVATLRKNIKTGADTLVNALPFLFQLNLIRIGYLF